MRLSILATALTLGLGTQAALAQVTPVTPSSPTMPTMPQGQQDMMQMLQLAAHNQLGVLEYCQAQGYTGSEAVDLQRKILGMMPSPAKMDGIAEAEAAGKTGEVQAGGTHVKLVDAAKTQNTTPEAMCKQISSMLQQQAAMLPK